MPRSIVPVRGSDVTRERATDLTPVAAHPAVDLTSLFRLPRLDLVPIATKFSTVTAELTAASQCFAHAGILRPEHFGVRRGRALLSAVETALAELVEPHERRWNLYTRNVSVGFSGNIEHDITPDHDSYEDEGSWRSHIHGAPEENSGPHTAVMFHSSNWTRESRFIGRTLEEFDRQHKGAGPLIMSLLEIVLGYGVGAITPRTAFDIVQSHCWWGEGDEKGALQMAREEYCGKIEKPTPRQLAEEFNFPLQEDLDRWFPRWTYEDTEHWRFMQRKRTRLKLPDIPKWRGHRAKEVREVCEKMQNLIVVTERKYEGMLNQYHQLSYTCEWAKPVIVRWRKEDRIPALYDDVMQQIAQAAEECMSTCGAVFFTPGDPKQCVQAGERLRLMLEATSLADELISIFLHDEKLMHVMGRELNQYGTANLTDQDEDF